MKKMTGVIFVVALSFILGTARAAEPNLPPDFPGLTVSTCDTNAVGDGYIFLTVTDSSTNGGYYLMMLRNDGTPVWYQKVPNHNYDFKVLPNGYLHYALFYYTHSWTGGGDCTHEILDDSYTPRESITAGNGYAADGHDFQLLPNGHALLIGYYKTQMDASKYVVGGYPNALVAGAILQELDEQRNVVFQWRSWDHFTIASYYGPYGYGGPAGKNPVIDAFHLNSVVLDTDGNLLVSNFGMDVWKINRQTGEIMWRLGALANQFSFVGVDPKQALGHFSGHTLSRLENGNILIYCNADQQATRSSKVYEYKLDETKKVATLMWTYAPSTNYYAWHYGSAQRLANGNTFIGWGGANIMPGIGGVTNQWIPACTEVTPDGRVVFEMRFNDPKMASYRAFRFVYPPASQASEVSLHELAAGNTYEFANDNVNTGVTIKVLDRTGDGYNTVRVTREPYAPVYPQFPGKAPRIMPVRVSMEQSSIESIAAEIRFDADSFGFKDPNHSTVYYRPFQGHGLFIPLPTNYNPATRQLRATMTGFGEFIVGYPDVDDVALAPILNEPESWRGIQEYEIVGPLPASPGTNYTVNQELPISLSWSPRGFARWYELQIATSQDFAVSVVDVPYQTDAYYVWNAAAPNTTYFYRVRTQNDGGESEWSVGSFQTVAPKVQVTVPNGGESWKMGLSYFIQWSDNIAESVVIELYKGGAFVKTIATAPSTGAYKWEVGLDLEPGNDYSIKIKSSANGTLSDASDAAFTIQ